MPLPSEIVVHDAWPDAIDSGPETEAPSSESSLEAEYLAVAQEQLGRLGIPEDVVSAAVQLVGTATDGRDIYLVRLKVTSWNRPVVLRVLLGVGMLEWKMRCRLAGTWLPEVSHFEGVAVRVSSRLHRGEPAMQLRAALEELRSAPGCRHLP